MPSRLTSFLSVLMAPSAMSNAPLSKLPRQIHRVDLSDLPGVFGWQFPHFTVSETRDGELRTRMRRVSELPSPWRESIACLVLDEPNTANDESGSHAFQQVRAILHEGALSLGGVPLVELILRDDGASLERHYVMAHSYLRTRACLRTLIEDRAGHGARMEADASGHGGLYLEAEEGGCWLLPDADDSRRTRFIHVHLDQHA